MRFSTPRTTREPLSICICASRRKPSSSAAAPCSSALLVFSFFSCLSDFRSASAKRSSSASISDSAISYSGIWTAPISTTCASPIAMPAETPRPLKTISRRSPSPDLRRRRDLAPSSCLSFFIELPVDQIDQGGERRAGPGADRAQLDLAADPGRQHHQAHDRAAFHVGLAFDDANVGVIGIGDLDELGRGPGMQTLLVLDL